MKIGLLEKRLFQPWFRTHHENKSKRKLLFTTHHCLSDNRKSVQSSLGEILWKSHCLKHDSAQCYCYTEASMSLMGQVKEQKWGPFLIGKGLVVKLHRFISIFTQTLLQWRQSSSWQNTAFDNITSTTAKTADKIIILTMCLNAY